jgi:hypothetical protein
VKFRNNPQHFRVLGNELLATRLAEAAGLPVPPKEVVEVGDWLVENSSDLNIQLSGRVIRCQPGLQFGSRYVVDPLPGGQIFDYFPVVMLERVRNLESLAGMLGCSISGPRIQTVGKQRSGERCARKSTQ